VFCEEASGALAERVGMMPRRVRRDTSKRRDAQRGAPRPARRRAPRAATADLSAERLERLRSPSDAVASAIDALAAQIPATVRADLLTLSADTALCSRSCPQVTSRARASVGRDALGR
jgi:hypothetical protein